MRSLCGCLILLSLVACSAVGPDYQRPPVEIPKDWRIPVSATEDLVDSAWWQLFRDPCLTNLVHQALQMNKEILLAAERVEQYLAILQSTRAEFFPQAGYSFDLRRQDNGSAATSPFSSPSTTYKGLMSVTWELDFWGRIRRADEAARAELLATEEDRRAVLVSLVGEVAVNYVILRGLDKQLEIAQETRESYGETLRLFRLRHRQGTISGIELKQIESQYSVAAQAVPRLQAAIGQQENLLSLLLGSPPGSIERGKSIDELFLPPLPHELPLTLLERRPDIRRAEQQLIAANARIGEAKALYYPTISLAPWLGRQSSDVSDFFEGGSGMWSIGGSLVGPIFSFGAISGQVQQAQSLTRQAILRYEQTILTAFKDVENALMGTLSNQELLAEQERQVKILADYSRLSRLSFDNGNGSYLQVLDAERTLFSAQLNRVQTQMDLFAALVDMYRSLAGGWIEHADSLANIPLEHASTATIMQE